jgi:UDP-GlcNAc:undecaprenyl-phosphate/decaprenyl-phosphate GlcNAc-1-phosphate transferase
MSRLPIRSAAAAAAAAVIARLSYAGLRRCPPGGDGTWSRTNHRGEPVTLLEGPAITLGGIAGTLLVPGLPRRSRAAMLIAGAGAAALGCYDDLAGSGSSRGFRGHLGALRRGELTTGAVKLAGIGVTGLAASALLRGTGTPGTGTPGTGPAAGTGPAPGTVAAGARDAADILINAGLVAGGANLLNLFDLRPGRALKVAFAAGALLAAAPGPGRQALAAPLGAAAALLADDLGERAMLGDGGANALGALLGTTAAVTLPRPARLVTLAAVAGLTAASEVVSFTRVIERTRPLRWLDMLGRRPVAAPVPGPAAPGPAPGPAAPAPAPGPAPGDQPESAPPTSSTPR